MDNWKPCDEDKRRIFGLISHVWLKRREVGETRGFFFIVESSLLCVCVFEKNLE
jgi:hypothetical protein